MTKFIMVWNTLLIQITLHCTAKKQMFSAAIIKVITVVTLLIHKGLRGTRPLDETGD